ncbi:ATP-binding protein [Limnohabitans sp. 63ED37-2]|uniref:ATP-binding protein n=1 Tax=Limnohabitans sp. 63ED37-2 TaxID=1678128 RepID=UPI0007066D42|nr:ATP-binding protein [Limnohabitans sp. 63ED37-2]ALK90188.1 Sensory/regulatory protein RpfC [Limnohabitans sp. 63ED37-2]
MALIGAALARMVTHLPKRYQQGKMPYVFFFVVVVIAVLLTYAVFSPYSYANVIFTSFAACLFALLVMVNRGFSLDWATHLATGLGALVLFYAAWSAGGVYSPRLAWMLILPLTPFYVISRRAGIFWLLAVLLLQFLMVVSNHQGWIQSFETGMAHVPSSLLTYTLVTCVLIVVPLMYDHMYRQALEESRKHQRELEARREELEHTSAMREHFIATVSHELRTPMNAILGFNALLLARVQGKPEALKVLNHTRQSADHLMTVINDILDYSQLQSGQLVIQPETFELRHIAQHAFELFKPRVESMNLDYRLVLDPALPVWVHTDRHRLMQVLVNLLGNALKFTHQGSVVLQVRWTDPGVEFSVQDTGIGIAKERQEQIFKRFAQAENDTQTLYGGNGLGLAISQKLAQLLGGAIGFESEPGQGSRFWLQLPLTAASAPLKSAEQLLQPLQSADRAWTFLVADDHPVNRLLLKQVLQNAWPHSVVLEAVDGQKALDVLREQPVDLVFMDMVMPIMDGIDATRLIRQDALDRIHQVPVLGLTANVNPLDLECFKSAGLNGVMLKPFEPATLCHRAETLLLPTGDAA